MIINIAQRQLENKKNKKKNKKKTKQKKKKIEENRKIAQISLEENIKNF